MIHSARTESSDGAKVNFLNSTFDGIYLIVKFGEIKEARMVKMLSVNFSGVFGVFIGALLRDESRFN